MDRLSNLPDNVIEAILELLSVRDAVRTGILLKRWRYRWETMSRLHLDYAFFDNMYRRGKPPSIDYVSLIRTIMLQHWGPLLKFVIYIPVLDSKDWADINLIVHRAIRKGVQELCMVKAGKIPHILPLVLFTAAEQLTKLKLHNCVFNPPPTFEGFPNLKFLELNSVNCPNLELVSSFISRCPELRSILLENLDNLDEHLCVHAVKLQQFHLSGCFGPISLRGMQELSSLVLFLEEQAMPCKDMMHHIFGQMCKLQFLKLGGHIFDLLAAESLPAKLSLGLNHLKKIVATSIDLGHPREVHCLLCLIRSSPNLQELRISVFGEGDTDGEPYNISETEIYAESCLQHLQTVRFRELTGIKVELKLIEHLLGCSPVLEIMTIELMEAIDKDARLEVLKEVTRFCRASPKAQVCC